MRALSNYAKNLINFAEDGPFYSLDVNYLTPWFDKIENMDVYWKSFDVKKLEKIIQKPWGFKIDDDDDDDDDDDENSSNRCYLCGSKHLAEKKITFQLAYDCESKPPLRGESRSVSSVKSGYFQYHADYPPCHICSKYHYPYKIYVGNKNYTCSMVRVPGWSYWHDK